MKTTDFSPLFNRIAILIDDASLIQNVFVHRSYLNEHRTYPLSSNEKLEFLGDSVLSLITSIYLYKNYPALAEGEYTDIKASVVRMESLAAAATTLGLGSYLLLSKGEEANKGRTNTNILADCFEALIGAIFLNKGFETAYSFVQKYLFEEKLDEIVRTKAYLSPKSHLQEIAQEQFKVLPVYQIQKEEGPEHNKLFEVSVRIQNELYGVGTGKSKKQAEEQAARFALEKLTSN
ncbi:MAG TPA: ribonuclease III [Candidatus Woesebacteria bacterium]|nr:ribonuclease III [Candidatus Woesebacteria bacterium]HNS94446.1 ribonuclease III [Candidatus Woesebacteria bacterium]